MKSIQWIISNSDNYLLFSELFVIQWIVCAYNTIKTEENVRFVRNPQQIICMDHIKTLWYRLNRNFVELLELTRKRQLLDPVFKRLRLNRSLTWPCFKFFTVFQVFLDGFPDIWSGIIYWHFHLPLMKLIILLVKGFQSICTVHKLRKFMLFFFHL